MTTACSTYYQYFDTSTSGALTHRYYVRDYLGSTRAVVDLYGNLEQTNDYNVTGIVAPPAKDGELNVIYNRVHNNATPQTAIKQAFYNGLNETSDINNATRTVWYVTTPDNVKIIQYLDAEK